MRAPALVLSLAVATLTGGCGASSSLDDTQPVVTIPDVSKTTSPTPPAELASDPTSTELDDLDDVAPAEVRLDAAPFLKKMLAVPPAKLHHDPRDPEAPCLVVDCR